MPDPHPLNQAVIAQALHDLRNGQLRRAKSMGFDDTALEALKHPAMASLLANATVKWCSVSVNQEVLHHLLSQVNDVTREIEEIDRLLRLGASTELISKFYGLTHQEIALRRDVIGYRNARAGIRSCQKNRTLISGIAGQRPLKAVAPR